MASELDIFINQTFTDILSSRGFKKRGRTYRLTSPAGDQILFNISSDALQGTVQYFVLTVAVTPLIMLDYYHHTLGSPINRPLRVSDWVATSNILAPSGQYSRNATIDWPFKGVTESAETATEIRRILTGGILDYLCSLLDRRSLLSLTRAEAGSSDEWALLWSTFNSTVASILLLIQDGPSDELATALRQAKIKGYNQTFEWARSYLDRHPR